MPAPIVLLTDFGASDPYAAQMKGAIMRRAGDLPLVDLTHEVEPQNVLQAGFLLASTLPHFPGGTLYVAVVDPGVGSSRRIVCARFERYGALVLAPDNGLLGFPLLLHGPPDHETAIRDCSPAVSRLARAGSVSATFHGRDLFAPLAADLANGMAMEDLGDAMDPADLVSPDLPGLVPADQNPHQSATILHTDRFGNAVLSLLPEANEPVSGFTLHQPGHAPATVRRAACYADLGPGELGLLLGSQGFLELALNRDSAARRLGLAPGQILTLIRS